MLSFQKMPRTLLTSKISRASVTHCELNYEGSHAIDEDLPDASTIRENEQVPTFCAQNGFSQPRQTDK